MNQPNPLKKEIAFNKQANPTYIFGITPVAKTCYDLGVNSYVVKPIEFDEFQKAITDLELYWMIVNHLPQ